MIFNPTKIPKIIKTRFFFIKMIFRVLKLYHKLPPSQKLDSLYGKVPAKSGDFHRKQRCFLFLFGFAHYSEHFSTTLWALAGHGPSLHSTLPLHNHLFRFSHFLLLFTFNAISLHNELGFILKFPNSTFEVIHTFILA